MPLGAMTGASVLERQPGSAYVSVHNSICIYQVPMQDKSQADGQPWTRFVFNTDALLEEEAIADDASNDVGFGAFDFRQHKPAHPCKADENAHEVILQN